MVVVDVPDIASHPCQAFGFMRVTSGGAGCEAGNPGRCVTVDLVSEALVRQGSPGHRLEEGAFGPF